MLTTHERQLTVEFAEVLVARLLLVTRPFTEHPGEPVADLFIFDAKLVKKTEHLLIEI